MSLLRFIAACSIAVSCLDACRNFPMCESAASGTGDIDDIELCKVDLRTGIVIISCTLSAVLHMCWRPPCLSCNGAVTGANSLA